MLVVAVSCAGTLGARAADNEARVYALREVLRSALTRGPTVVSALATLRRVQAEQALARMAYLPSLTGRVSAGADYDNRLVVPGQPRLDSKSLDARSSLTVSWAVVDTSRGHTLDAAKRFTAAQLEHTELARQQQMAAVVELYLRALTAQKVIDDARLTLERRESQHQAIVGLVKAGVRPDVDAQRANIEVLSARYVLKTRVIEQQAAQAALSAAMGTDPLEPTIPAPLSDERLLTRIELKDALVLAERNRPETREYARRVEARRAELAAAAGARLPTVGFSGTGNASYLHVFGGLGIEGSQYGASGGLYLNWAGLDPTVWSRVKVARTVLNEAEAQLQRASIELRRDVTAASYTVETTAAQLEQAVSVLSATQVTREAQNVRYRAGVASLLELLDTEELEQRSRQSRITAELAQLTAQAALLAACGVIEQLAQ